MVEHDTKILSKTYLNTKGKQLKLLQDVVFHCRNNGSTYAGIIPRTRKLKMENEGIMSLVFERHDDTFHVVPVRVGEVKPVSDAGCYIGLSFVATRFLEREVRNIDSEHFVFPESGVKKPAEPKKTQGPPLPNASVPVATDKPKQIRRRRRRKR